MIGFSATPQLMSKKINLSQFYENIHVSCTVTDLIEQGYLMQPKTYAPKKLVEQIAGTNFKIKNGEYDEKFQTDFF